MNYNFELKYSNNNADIVSVLFGDHIMAIILLHLTLSAVGMYITYRIGFRSGIQAGIRTLAGVLNASFALRGNNTDTPSGGKENSTRHPDSGEG